MSKYLLYIIFEVTMFIALGMAANSAEGYRSISASYHYEAVLIMSIDTLPSLKSQSSHSRDRGTQRPKTSIPKKTKTSRLA